MPNFKNLATLVLNLSFAHLLLRLTANILLMALTTPVFLFNPVWKTSAQRNIPVQQPAPISLPPEAFIVSNTSSLSNSITTAFGSFLSFSNKTISGLFEKPKIPAGLEQAENQLTPTESLAPGINNPNLLLTLPTGSVRYDFDGDGKADIARWHSSNTEWKVKNSSSGNFTTTTIGSSSAIITPGDFDGDGKTDPAVFSGGTWTIKNSSNGQTVTISFGTSGDKPVVGNYDNDSKADCAVFRPSTNTWWILKSTDGSYTSTSFGNSGDITAQGNYDGDAYTDIAVFRPSMGDWHVLGSSAGYFTFHWGLAADIPVPADFDGDGKTDFAVYRGSTGTWYAAKSSTSNSQYFTQVWGNYGDQPTPADYDGDGKDDFAVWRPTTGIWYIIKSSNSTYDYPGLGVAGDTAISSAYLKQIGGYIYSYDFAKARLSPKNSTGRTDLYSRNFSWGASLVGLSGRAGLNAGFGISYNSLVWTKDSTNNSIVFNADNSNVTPGFRFGFPTIEPVYYDGQTGKFSYLMVTPSGARVEFRQTAASGVYETADSSYTQLKINDSASPNDPAENLTITVTSTDGTQMLYEWKNGTYRCQKITDRNGNYITINHDANGLLQTVTDTLGRVITVNYNSDNLPSSITQVWKDTNGSGSNVTRTYATFTYTTQQISTNFSGLTVIGPGDGYSLKVLQKITFPTETNGAGPNTVFAYNTWGQVKQITNYAADNHELNYVKINLPADATSSQTDCPRFTETRSKIENFNQDQNGNAQEVVVTNSITENQSYNVGGNSGTATKIEVSMANDPYNHISKTFVGSSGWMESLPIATEDWANGTSGSERKRWTWRNWTQDDTNLSYILNPRTTVSIVGDTNNIKKIETDYYPVSTNSPIALYGLVKEVRVFDSNGTTVLKKAVTEYNLDNAYLSRRIIGLPSKTELYGLETSGLNLMSKVTYNYDEGDFSDSNLAQNISTAIQHDNTNFSSSLTTGRGNPTSTKRWNVQYPTTSSEAVSSSVKYNTAGAPVAQIDSIGREIKISYTDVFNDNQNRNTFAYPTKLTDPANNYSEVKYRFDIGTNVWAKSPAPAGNTIGKETTRLYDSIGRPEKETVVNTGAYTRYEYPNNGVQSKVYTTIVDANNDGADATDEVLSESWTDGSGRVKRSRTEHPNSTGGWTGSLVEYDILGQVKRSTVPTEISVNTGTNVWTPAGDDATRGWLWSSQEYDWKGRVTRSIPSDSNGSDGKDQIISYDGCGCAGGQVTTIQSELVPVPNQINTNARRTQKVYADILGRTYKTEVLDWTGTAYTTALTTFNGRDQELSVVQQDNTQNPVVSQTTTMTYDGHGRLATQHRPVQDANTNTSYTYNKDDSIETVTDARGATTNYSYNSIGLVEEIHYSVPTNSNILVPDDVTFSYDALGNRTQMVDGLGNVAYEYDELSRMKSETRQFTDTLTNAPLSNNRFKLEYTYILSGQLKSLKDPFGQQINYGHDKIGRLNAVTGSSFGGVTSYADNPGYRAWGALKSLDYGDTTQMHLTFNNRLQADSFKLDKSGTSIIEKNYQFYEDGKVKYIQDQINDKYDVLYKYDHVGRIIEGKSAVEARGGTQTNLTQLPYRQSFTYNAFNDMTSSDITKWTDHTQETNTFTNHRRTNNVVYNFYDADGRDLRYGRLFDAAGRNYNQTFDSVITDYHYFDGDGKEAKRGDTRWNYETEAWNDTDYAYYIRSTVLSGEIITEVDKDGKKAQTFVRAAGTIIARQKTNETEENVYWEHRDPAEAEVRYKKSDGSTPSSMLLEGGQYDPTGRLIGPYFPTRPSAYETNIRQRVPSPFNENSFESYINSGCSVNLDGIPTPCELAFSFSNEHLGLEVRDGNRVRRYEFQHDLPGGRLSVWIPIDHSYEGDRGRVIDDENYTGSTSGNSVGGIQTGFWVTFDLNWALKETIIPIEDKNKNRGKRGGSGKGKPDYKKLTDALTFCAREMFGVELLGRDGDTYNFRSETGVYDHTTNTVQKNFSIGIDYTTFSMADMSPPGGEVRGFTARIQNRSGATITGIYQERLTAYGKTFMFQTNTVFVARDITRGSDGATYEGAGLNIPQKVHTGIHELGNSLAQITGILGARPNPRIDPKTNQDVYAGHQDEGMAFENCVLINYKNLLAGRGMDANAR